MTTKDILLRELQQLAYTGNYASLFDRVLSLVTEDEAFCADKRSRAVTSETLAGCREILGRQRMIRDFLGSLDLGPLKPRWREETEALYERSDELIDTMHLVTNPLRRARVMRAIEEVERAEASQAPTVEPPPEAPPTSDESDPDDQPVFPF